ncbi:MAG: hypothetical protein KGI54_15135 [Pseudomonadota bacterium]|nr:hypothetical protein [Pseudomonadota bacterium]
MTKVIGIDPGTKTGLASFMNGELVDMTTTDFWGCIEQLTVHDDAIVVLEIPTTKHVWHGKQSDSTAVKHRTGFNVGSCYTQAQLIAEWLILKGRRYITHNPQGKLDAKELARITGWTKRTNQHERDAAMIGWKYRNMRQS